MNWSSTNTNNLLPFHRGWGGVGWGRRGQKEMICPNYYLVFPSKVLYEVGQSQDPDYDAFPSYRLKPIGTRPKETSA